MRIAERRSERDHVLQVKFARLAQLVSEVDALAASPLGERLAPGGDLQKLVDAFRSKQEFDDTVPQGRVTRQSPEAGQKLPQGQTVTIWVSKGPPPVKVPDVTGLPVADAVAALQQVGFTVKQKEAFSTEVPRDSVISTDPPAGTTLDKGSKVTIVVSKGPRTFPMPDVVGMTKDEAVTVLQNAGLKVKVVFIPNTQGDQVVYQDPNPGTTVEQGQLVTIYVTGG